MFPRGYGVERYLPVRTRGRDDRHRIESVHLQHVAVVGEPLLDPVLICRVVQRRFITAAKGDDLGLRNIRKRLHVRAHETASANDADTNGSGL